jgi:hypothetical protein
MAAFLVSVQFVWMRASGAGDYTSNSPKVTSWVGLLGQPDEIHVAAREAVKCCFGMGRWFDDAPVFD